MSSARIVRDDDETFVARIPLGSDWYILGRWSLLIIGSPLVLALVALFALGRARTLTCRRDPAQCELREESFFGTKTEVLRRDHIVAVEVEQSLSKCQTKLRTRSGSLRLSLVFTVKCDQQRKTAAAIHAFLNAPTEPPLVAKYEERLMLVVYSVAWFGGAAWFLLATFWPRSLVLRIDRKEKRLLWRTRAWPWRRGARNVPIASVVKLSIDASDAGVHIALSLDDRTSVVAHGCAPTDPVALATTRDRLAAVLADSRSIREVDGSSP